MKVNLGQLEVWFVTGSQHLYGEEALRQVEAHSKEMAQGLDGAEAIPVRVVYKPVLTSSEEIHALCLEANAAANCIGLVTWMHTFSPARMWIPGLRSLHKPFVHLHTQYNREIPWDEIDMDFMNLNQSAHGCREFGYIASRLRLERKVIVGHWQDPRVLAELGTWTRAAAAWHDAQGAKIARFGDNMRQVAVTEGDKVEAEIQLGYSVNGYGIGDLVAYINEIADSEVDQLLAIYGERYQLAESLRPGGSQREALREAARIELGLRAFLQEGGFKGFTTTFEDLHGLSQLPGLAAQRLMADGIGFGAEGDWKTAALVRAMKVMGSGLEGGTSFMEDYTYHLAPSGMQVLGAHMLEVCESIAKDRPRLEIHPLDIGGKADPPRLVFDVASGPAICFAIMDLGNRFRLVLNEVDVVEPEQPLPKLPVARALWEPRPNLPVAATSWILAGGSHHSGFSQAVTTEHIKDFAEIAGLELLIIDGNTNVWDFKQQLKLNEVYYQMRRGF